MPEDLPVPPGSGWPEDPATPATPVAADAAQVRTLAAEAARAGDLHELTARRRATSSTGGGPCPAGETTTPVC